LSFTDRDHRPRQWAEVTRDIAKANNQIGIRTKGPAVQQRLAKTVAASRAALQVRTRELLPQQWAATQNNLGIALGEQGIRTGGEEGRRLLAQALDAFRGALGIYQAAGAGHHVQIIERNIALTELFVSAASDPDAQFTLGVLYARGQAVEQDDAKAVQWLRKAAVQGHGHAQLFLGVMILSGRGVD
jgi:TPR repeat protein